MLADHFLLAGGGHTHALILRRWAMHPHLRPKGLITLINRSSRNIYSSMFPGIISRQYKFDDAVIDLASLANRSGVSFVIGEIIGLDPERKKLFLENRPPIGFSLLSLDVGSETFADFKNFAHIEEKLVAEIKPFRSSYEWIEQFDDDPILDSQPLTVIGSGHSAFEIVLALRKRWPRRPLRLQAYESKINKKI